MLDQELISLNVGLCSPNFAQRRGNVFWNQSARTKSAYQAPKTDSRDRPRFLVQPLRRLSRVIFYRNQSLECNLSVLNISWVGRSTGRSSGRLSGSEGTRKWHIPQRKVTYSKFICDIYRIYVWWKSMQARSAEAELRLGHKLFPPNAWMKVLHSNALTSCPKDELHEWFIWTLRWAHHTSHRAPSHTNFAATRFVYIGIDDWIGIATSMHLYPMKRLPGYSSAWPTDFRVWCQTPSASCPVRKLRRRA
jgi:hypothetical protein